MRSKAQSEAVFNTKIRGTLVLKNIFKSKRLDFCIYYSSISSVIAQIGQVAYCAANTFLDKIAKFQYNKRTFVTSINWDAWQKVGMAEDSVRKLNECFNIDLSNGILPEEGIEVFKQILKKDFSQIIVCTSKLSEQINSVHHQKEKTKILYNWIGTGGKSNDQHIKKTYRKRPELKNEYFAPQTEIENQLTEIWQEVLGIEKVGIKDDFFMLGGSSLSMIRTISIVKEKMGEKVDLQTFYSKPTIKELAFAINYTKTANATKVRDSDHLLIFNNTKDAKIFCFPPKIAFGLIYEAMSSYLSDYCFYSFDFVENLERMKYYTEKIIKLSDGQPIILMGYSLGGRLAYQVALELISQNIVPKAIVMIDSYCGDYLKTKDDLDFKKSISLWKKGIKEIGLNIDEAKIISTITNYNEFYKQNPINKILNIPIHIITATDRDELISNMYYESNKLVRSGALSWDELCTSKVHYYKGYGIHNDMLSGNNLLDNCKILRQIIKSII